jgi:hypothetical protein
LAERSCQLADDLVAWAGQHIGPRRDTGFAIRSDEEYALYRLRRLAADLRWSAHVPAAAALYGPSQVGKSLFLSRILEPATEGETPLGKCDQLGPPAYLRQLSFERDINPKTGSMEATALVTRFTTPERCDQRAFPECPVKVQALTRAEWLCALALGFRSECRRPTGLTWWEGQLWDLFEEVSRSHPADSVDRDWQADLHSVYRYVRHIDPQQYAASESMFDAFLSHYPLTDKGYTEIAGRMFWDHQQYPALTMLFHEVCRFLAKITRDGRDGILIHWAAVRFLLDSQRRVVHESADSKWQTRVAWQDLRDGFRDGWYVIDYAPGGRGPSEDLAIIQAAMLEMILPVMPHHLSEDWRQVLRKMDLLDLPGIRAGGGDAVGGTAALEGIDQAMSVAKRGKVSYLIDRYLEERQVSTLLLLVRGFNLEVRQLLKTCVDKWGWARYGEEAWPRKVLTDNPALFIGMTGIDEEFRDRELSRALYDNRLTELVDATFYDVMTDFGGPGRPFTNVFPIRYPGTWDWDEATRRGSRWERNWEKAAEAFLGSPLVRKHVADAAMKWEVAMRDGDGGLSLISKGFIGCTDSLQKQDALQERIQQLQHDLRMLAEGWYRHPDADQDREARIAAAHKVLQWLADEGYVYERVQALRNALCLDEGDALAVAEFATRRAASSRVPPEALEQRFSSFLKGFLGNWARREAPLRWREYAARHDVSALGLSNEDFGRLARYLCDYLCSAAVFPNLVDRLLAVITLSFRDQWDRRHTQREYVRVILNDFVLNPGPSDEPLQMTAASDGRDFGLMETFVRRWQTRLPAVLASAAEDRSEMPSGSEELQRILCEF